MPGYLGIPREKMRLVPLGINLDGYAPRPPRRRAPFTIGYFARIAPEKGLHVLADAYRRLRERPGIGESRLVAAGYLAPEHQGYLDGVIEADLRHVGPGGSVRVSRRGGSRAEDRFPAKPRRAVGAGDLRGAEGHLPARGDGHAACRSCSRAAARFRRSSRRPAEALIVDADDPERAGRRACSSCGATPRARRRLARRARPACATHYSVERMAEAVEAGLSKELVGIDARSRVLSASRHRRSRTRRREAICPS